MTFIKEYSGVIALVILAIAGILNFTGVKTPSFGSTACDQTTCLIGGLRVTTGNLEGDGTVQVGSSGTAQSNQVATTCAMKMDLSIAATTSGYAFCTGVTGVTSADSVLAGFASSTGTITVKDSWAIIGAKASSTAGAIDFDVMNLTGAAAVPSAISQIGSSTVIRAGH